MRKYLALLLTLLMITSCSAAENDEPQFIPNNGGALFNGKKVLVAYFSWGGTTRRMAEAIVDVTGGDLFEIEPVNPYPISYTPCTEVALEERDTDARPAIKNSVANWDEYDIVFVGCPVWWHTAPMIISTFAESYDFAGKTVVPFCTYAATYRDETLQKIVDLTPDARHLEGLGTTGSTNGVEAWINRISAINESSGISGNFDHEVTQPAPGGDASDGGPQAVSNITSVAGVPLVRLNNGVMMPRFGLGTQVQSMEGANQRQQLNETVRGMVISALQSGYRHLDDAMFYYNERGAGWGIKESGIPREEIWLTSKISGDLADAQNAFEGMLQRLQVDYIDLVYIHHPAGTLSDILACWRVMEKEYKAGRIRALGISNFDNRMDAFNYIMQNAEIKPQVAQIECHPLAQRKEARQLYADNYDIQVECWYPLNHNRGDVSNTTLQQIASAHNKSVYQIILRWHMQEGLCPVPGSTNPAHILENISIFDFELSDEEMTAIRAIDRGEAGRSFNISYGNWNFGNFQDYTYNHTYTPSAIESVLIDSYNHEYKIYTLDGKEVPNAQKGLNIIRSNDGITKKVLVR
ncbi:MAG: aldo/keto reductase [Bacteroides sp.]|nr:aldo/keto reductase [Roseburia sp.]MCM1345832.1 aldo/keto reductase [Bacteroides sp.]MCM1420222.1 aldo/keto reductase [Bacteroides sp.]